MPTKNPRINVTFEPNIMTVLTALATQEHKSLSSLAKELIIEALDRREDMILSAIADARDSKDDDLIKHDDAWK